MPSTKVVLKDIMAFTTQLPQSLIKQRQEDLDRAVLAFIQASPGVGLTLIHQHIKSLSAQNLIYDAGTDAVSKSLDRLIATGKIKRTLFKSRTNKYHPA